MEIAAGNEQLLLAIAASTGYLLGSIPFGLVLGWIGGHGDIRKIGSGNIGATNVLRTGNKPLAAATLVLDSGKGGAAVLIFATLGPETLGLEPALIAGLAAVIGHNFPIWLGFRGGKGVATTLGTLIAAAWPVGLLACATWLAAAAIFRMSSLAALVALTASPFFALWLAGWQVAALAGALAVLAILRHHANIGRILRGEEPKIGRKKETS